MDMATSNKEQAERVTGEVAGFYAHHPFPGERRTDADGLLLMRCVASLLTDRRYRLGARRPRLLDAGCGTGNTSVALARTFPALNVHGVDICARSLELAHARALEAEAGNVCFTQGDLLAGPPPGRPYDIVVCLGVLHHTADMRQTLGNLAAALGSGGRLLLWVYGRHGRYHHDLNRRLLRLLLESGDDPDSRVALARAFALETGDGAPLRDLYGFVPGSHAREQVVLQDAWIADQFLHVNECAVDMPELLDLLDGAGLVLDEWLGAGEVGRLRPPVLAERLAALPERERLCAADLLLKPRRYFVTAHRKGG
jgi:SAM-dependent methyltransferase